MKNSEIHIGLENAELRDFFSILLAKNFDQDSANKKINVEYKPDFDSMAIDYSIKDCENEISFQKKRLQILKEAKAIVTLIRMHGWSEFDVSDETQKDLDYKLKLSFIGTESEYNDLLTRLK